MIKKLVVTSIIRARTDCWIPHIVTNNGSMAGIPKMFLDRINIGDTVSVLSDDDMNMGGFSAVVIGVETK